MPDNAGKGAVTITLTAEQASWLKWYLSYPRKQDADAASRIRDAILHAEASKEATEDVRQENQWAIDMVRAYEAALEQLRPIYPVVVCRIEDIVVALIDGDVSGNEDAPEPEKGPNAHDAQAETRPTGQE